MFFHPVPSAITLVRWVNENAFASMVQARPIPPLADRFITGATPIDYGPGLLLMPFGFHLAMDTLPSGVCKWWLQVHLGCIQLSPSCPFRLLHTFHFSGQRGYQPRFWIRHSSSERRRDFNPPEQRAAQHTPWFYPRLVAYGYFWLSEGA